MAASTFQNDRPPNATRPNLMNRSNPKNENHEKLWLCFMWCMIGLIFGLMIGYLAKSDSNFNDQRYNACTQVRQATEQIQHNEQIGSTDMLDVLNKKQLAIIEKYEDECNKTKN